MRDSLQFSYKTEKHPANYAKNKLVISATKYFEGKINDLEALTNHNGSKNIAELWRKGKALQIDPNPNRNSMFMSKSKIETSLVSQTAAAAFKESINLIPQQHLNESSPKKKTLRVIYKKKLRENSPNKKVSPTSIQNDKSLPLRPPSERKTVQTTTRKEQNNNAEKLEKLSSVEKNGSTSSKLDCRPKKNSKSFEKLANRPKKNCNEETVDKYLKQEFLREISESSKSSKSNKSNKNTKRFKKPIVARKLKIQKSPSKPMTIEKSPSLQERKAESKIETKIAQPTADETLKPKEVTTPCKLKTFAKCKSLPNILKSSGSSPEKLKIDIKSSRSHKILNANSSMRLKLLFEKSGEKTFNLFYLQNHQLNCPNEPKTTNSTAIIPPLTEFTQKLEENVFSRLKNVGHNQPALPKIGKMYTKLMKHVVETKSSDTTITDERMRSSECEKPFILGERIQNFINKHAKEKYERSWCHTMPVRLNQDIQRECEEKIMKLLEEKTLELFGLQKFVKKQVSPGGVYVTLEDEWKLENKLKNIKDKSCSMSSGAEISLISKAKLAKRRSRFE